MSIQLLVSPIVAIPRMFPRLVLLGAMLLWPAIGQLQAAPLYDLNVFLDARHHLITGILTVRLPAEDGHPRKSWWFHLPPNRFTEEDPRGVRQSLGPSPVGRNFSKRDPIDLMLPSGFSSGSIEILAVLDEEGRSLSFAVEANDDLPTGYWQGDALMQVFFDPESSGREATIQFVTHLPNRHVDGWDEAGIVAEKWHPMLMNYSNGQWERDSMAPIPSQYEARVQVDKEGWFSAGPSVPQHIQPEAAVVVPNLGETARVFPLIFLSGLQTKKRELPDLQLQVFFQEDYERIAELTLEVGSKFSEFMKSRYGLRPPRSSITFIQSDLATGEISTVGDAIIIPMAHFKNNPILDRVYTSKLARAIAEVWFGNTVWANQDSQAWLHLGLTGYLSLEFFRFLYGWDAGIHDLVDWLNPKYREHYFEAKVVAQIRNEDDVPLTASLHNHPNRAGTAISLFQKAPLVIRSLAYVVGERNFRSGLSRFYTTHKYREVTVEDFRKAMEEAAGESLEWYFDAWFHGTTRVDYALGEWRSQPVDGGFRVSVEILRLEPGIMPVELQVLTEGGGTSIHRWDGKAERTTLEFTVPAPVEKLVLDPNEYLLETNRKNNQSFTSVRWRPFYDWSKQRETLVTFFVTLGGNAVDGNTIGIGTKIRFNQDQTLRILPIFAQKTSETLYKIDYSVGRLFSPRLSFLLGGSKLGGKETVRTGIKYKHDLEGDLDFDTLFLLQVERVQSESLGSSGSGSIQQSGATNNFVLQHKQAYFPSQPNSAELLLRLERSQPDFGSDFRYTSLVASYSQDLSVHANHSFHFELIRGRVDGNTPLQKKHLLGGPEALRGFPRTLALVSDNVAILRSEYLLVLTRGIMGESVQTRKLTLILFADIGKGWNNDEDFDQVLTRKDIGFGFNLDLDALTVFKFPVRVEVAFPIDDPQFKNRQVIFFQALIGF